MSAAKGPGPHAGEGWCLCAQPAPAMQISFGGVAYLCGDCSGLLRPGDCRCVARGAGPYGIAKVWAIHNGAVRGVLRRAGLSEAEIDAADEAYGNSPCGPTVARDPNGAPLYATELEAMNEAVSALRAPCRMPRCAPLLADEARAFEARLRAITRAGAPF